MRLSIVIQRRRPGNSNCPNYPCGIWAVVSRLTLFNEADNPREWPVEGHQLTADHVAYLYNAIYREVKDLPVKVGLGALDPFYGPGSNCMDWWGRGLLPANFGQRILQRING
jgi:hypothetical protein